MNSLEKYFYRIFYGPYNNELNSQSYIYHADLLRNALNCLGKVKANKYTLDSDKIFDLISDVEAATEGYCSDGMYLPVKSLTDPWTLQFILKSHKDREWVIKDFSSSKSEEYVCGVLIRYFKNYKKPDELNFKKSISAQDLVS